MNAEMATLLHVTGYVLSEMFDDYDGSLFTSDIETIAVEAAIADLPDLLVMGESMGWPREVTSWVRTFRDAPFGEEPEWPWTWESVLEHQSVAGGATYVATSLFFP